MTEPGPYTTITVDEYGRMKAVILHLRKRVQKARELLESGAAAEALNLLKFEEDASQ